MKIVRSDDDFNTKLGKYLFNARRKLGIKQSDLAKLLGISRTSLSLYENGKKMIKFDLILKIAEILNLDLIEIMPRREVKTNNKIQTNNKEIVEFELEIAIKHFLHVHKINLNEKELESMVSFIKVILSDNKIISLLRYNPDGIDVLTAILKKV